jgi:DNA-binding NtrC family response regulator
VARILVVDDDENICNLFRDTLEDSGHSATAVPDPLLALRLIQEQDFDLVFLDLMMQGMNGAELFGRIREVKPDLPVTIITGYTDSELMKSAVSYGPFGVMGKPFRATDILAVVSSYMRFARPGQ